MDCFIFLMVCSRKLRERDATKFHMQLCIALFLMLLVFVIGIDETDNNEGCITVSVLIFYFTLVSFMWMAAEALLMFQKLVIVFVHITPRYITAISILCWGMKTNLLFSQTISPHNIIQTQISICREVECEHCHRE